MNRFGDYFTYDESEEYMIGRKFKNCTLLKSIPELNFKKKGDITSEISIDPITNWMWVQISDVYPIHEYVPFACKFPSIHTIMNYVYSEIIKNNTILNIAKKVEDKYGTFLNFQMRHFIEEYAFTLSVEITNSVYIIKNYWKRSISDPTYLLCRKRLEIEFYRDLQPILNNKK